MYSNLQYNRNRKYRLKLYKTSPYASNHGQQRTWSSLMLVNNRTGTLLLNNFYVKNYDVKVGERFKAYFFCIQSGGCEFDTPLHHFFFLFFLSMVYDSIKIITHVLNRWFF